jgi:hypothetical protein
MSNENKVTNNELFTEFQQRGFYVSKVSQNEENGIDYLVVTAEPVKVKEVCYTERKDWSVDYGDGHE